MLALVCVPAIRAGSRSIMDFFVARTEMNALEPLVVLGGDVGFFQYPDIDGWYFRVFFRHG